MIALHAGDAAVARYREGLDVAPRLSPRPYLEAVTLGGEAVTAVGPADHLHHLGVSLAIPDVSRASFWGGRTFVAGRGSTMLDNHGVQRVLARDADGDGVEEELAWTGPDGAVLLSERRALRIAPDRDGWRMSWRSTLTADAGGAEFGSPHTNGRDGAFYGGIFWRTPFARALAVCAEGEGTEIAHGSRSPWLAIVGERATVVAATDSGLPWFVRTGGYVGFGPAVATVRRRVLAPSETLELDLSAVVLDGPVAADDAARIAERIRTEVRA
ncbi:PmoA family protein [Microbacterium barkeri]|uniref:DUF6807 domain-containing protein n=1 Tax=Microbacterium barkeri TaxID=33917 RepID=UPI0024AF4380|nr:PmoA family protein [Microbacterium barkeri]MDI6943462.1 PmoA family protein [Microbacterium barkeri]